jgi:hypothetical protein
LRRDVGESNSRVMTGMPAASQASMAATISGESGTARMRPSTPMKEMEAMSLPREAGSEGVMSSGAPGRYSRKRTAALEAAAALSMLLATSA